MADYYSSGPIQPMIPKRLVTEEDLDLLDAFNIKVYPEKSNNEESHYFFAPEWSGSAYMEKDGKDIELSEDDIFACFQKIIRRSNGEIPWVSLELGYSCSKDRPDGYGGYAVFITADDVQYSSTSQWLEQRISEAETGDFGPQTEDPTGTTSTTDQAPPILAIHIEGGLVQAVFSNNPGNIAAKEIIILDYDTEGADGDEIILVPQCDGTPDVEAVSHIELIHQAGIDLPETLRRLKGGDDGGSNAVQSVNDHASHNPTPEMINNKNPVTALQHPYFDLRSWREEVRDCNTKRGYHEWVATKVEESRDDREEAGCKVIASGNLTDGTRVEKLAVPPSECAETCVICHNDFRINHTSPPEAWAIVDTTAFICPTCAEENNLHGEDKERQGAA